MTARRLAVSNIAWPQDALDQALALLRDLGIDAVEIAPFNIFGRWQDLAEDAARFRDRLDGLGIRCVALQGILFNAPGVHLFRSQEAREALRLHLRDVAALAGSLGAGACVLGAPRQRDPGDLPALEAWETAVAFLRDIGPHFAAHGTALAFEPNARRYACRFVTGTSEAARLVSEAAAPGIGLQIDTGTVFLEGESLEDLLGAASLAVHAHLSEPDLRPVGADPLFEGSALPHATLAAALRDSRYGGVLSLEMRAAEDWKAGLCTAIDFARRTYA